MKSIKYILEANQYVLVSAAGPLKAALAEVALAYGVMTDTGRYNLYKHGCKEHIEEWVQLARSSLSSAGSLGQIMADEIHVISGRFDINLLNDAIQGDEDSLIKMITQIHGSSVFQVIEGSQNAV